MRILVIEDEAVLRDGLVDLLTIDWDGQLLLLEGDAKGQFPTPPRVSKPGKIELATVIIAGDVDEQAGTGDITVNADVDFVGCIVPTETVNFTLSGDPDVALSADIVITDQSITIDITAEGAVAFVGSDGRTGTCGIDLSLGAVASAVGVTQTLTGSACGADASNFDVVLFD